MSSVESAVEVRHNPAASRFEATVAGHLCVADYRLVDGVMRIHHTAVAPELKGRGIAGQIVRAALAYAEANGLKVEPWCGYVRAYMKRHPETLHLLPGLPGPSLTVIGACLGHAADGPLRSVPG